MTAGRIIPHALLPCNRISATIRIRFHVHDGAQWILQGHGIGHGEQSADGRFRFIVDAAGDVDEQVAEGGGRVMAIPLAQVFWRSPFPILQLPLIQGRMAKDVLQFCL